MFSLFVVYLYDVKAKSKKKFNRIKRRFYYHLNRLGLSKDLWVTKSTITIQPDKERLLDDFFKDFKKDVIVYKIHTETIEKLG